MGVIWGPAGRVFQHEEAAGGVLGWLAQGHFIEYCSRRPPLACRGAPILQYEG